MSAILSIPLIVAVALLGVLLSCRRWSRNRQTALREGSRIAPTERGPIEYAAAGAGPAILIFHGGLGGYDQALEVGDLLNSRGCDAGFTVLAPSRPGYLRTPLEVGRTPEEQADALAALLDHLAVDRVAVVGVSFGAPAALQFALRHPRRVWAMVMLAAIVRRCTFAYRRRWATRFLLSRFGIVFLDLFGWLQHLGMRRRPASQARRMLRRMTLRSVSDAEIDKRVESLCRNAEQLRTFRSTVNRMLPLGPRMTGNSNDEQQIGKLSDYPLERISTPTLVCQGREDGVGLGFADAEYLVGKIPGARLLALEQCGHCLWAAPTLGPVMEAIVEFLNNHAPKRPTANPTLG